MLPVIELNWKQPTLLAVVVRLDKKLVLRYPVLIGSNELLMMPPFAMVMPPFTLMVDAFRVEGSPLLGIYGAPLIVFTIRLVVLTLKELIEAARTMFVLRLLVDRKDVWIELAFTVVTFILAVIILAA